MSYGEGIDRYEAQSIAESAARSAADDAKRDVGYDVQRVADDVRALRSDNHGSHSDIRAEIAELWQAHAELAETVRLLQNPGAVRA